MPTHNTPRSKFKVGSLVCLSAAGEMRQGNARCRGGWGIVISVTECYWDKYPYQCRWFNARWGNEGEGHPFKEYELKKFKAGVKP